MTTPYKINGTALTQEPTTGRWLDRNDLGFDGNGRKIYAPLRQYEMKWEIIDPAAFVQLLNFYNAIDVTGSLVVDLPMYNSATGGFTSYTGCYMSEPSIDTYFEGWPTSASLLIVNIRT